MTPTNRKHSVCLARVVAFDEPSASPSQLQSRVNHESNQFFFLTLLKIAADTFAGEFFTEEIERQSRYNVVEIEVSFVSKGRDNFAPLWLLPVNIA